MTASTPTSAHVLVTGGAGFIGSHLVDRLLASGHRVTVLDDLSTGRLDNVAAHASDPRFRLVQADVAEPIAPDLGGADRPTHVVHLAAQVSVARSMTDPASDARVNLVGLLRVLDFARAAGVRRVLHASSAAVYGEVPLPAREDAAVAPISPYGLHKLAGEHHLRIAALGSDPARLDTASCRFFNVYGPRQVPGSEYAGVIAIFLARAAAGRPIAIYGDGAQTRDFVYVGDVVAALARLLFAEDRHDGRVFNVGTGHETAIRALAEACVAAVPEPAAGRSTIGHEPPRAGDIARSVAAAERLRATGWTPAVALADGLARTARWLLGGPSDAGS